MVGSDLRGRAEAKTPMELEGGDTMEWSCMTLLFLMITKERDRCGMEGRVEG